MIATFCPTIAFSSVDLPTFGRPTIAQNPDLIGASVPSSCYGVAIMVARTQITLHPEQHRRAKARAADLGISLAEYIRRLVDRDLDRPMAVPDPSTIFNLGDSGGSDVAA